MQNDILTSLTRLSDAELVASVKQFAACERGAAAQIIAHLAELDTRDVHLCEGYDSLYAYCRAVLHLSEWEAYNRIEVARTARRFPVILDMMAEGSLNLTAVRLLAPHLTPTNHGEVLRSALGKRKEEIKEIVANLSPRSDVPVSIRKLPSLPPRSVPSASPVVPAEIVASETAGTVCPATSMAVPRAAVEPLSPGRYRLQLTIAGDTLEKLRLAKDMLSHSLPSGDEAAVVDRALDALLVALARKRFADTRRPRPASGTRPGSPHAPAAVQRVVWVRDLGRCAFVGASGHRCNERRFVQFHHVDPRALGGEATVDLIQLRCRAHNDYEGQLYFGKRKKPRELVPEQVRLDVIPPPL